MKIFSLLLFAISSIHASSSESIYLQSDIKYGKRPATKVYIPKTAKDKLPLIVLLHGHIANGPIQNIYMGFGNKVDDKKYLLAIPTGIKDTQNHNFWNDKLFELSALKGHDSSQNQPQVDDIGFINNLIEQINKKHSVDFSRIYLIGHSNGGFMAYQYACTSKYPVKSVAVLAGGISKELICDRKFSVLHVHGTSDSVINYKGTPYYFSVDANLKFWLNHNQCETLPSKSSKRDLTIRFGDETTAFEWNQCKSLERIALWKINKGHHIPFIKRTFRNQVLSFLLD